ncbi:AMP-binding protein [Candidatus Paracaedibacter symbiosus]|uniref:AMP-binding protein n=1 Tax=Candidatus Paracaedibacter symbiosus TaxID=244582 RepID=UPI000509BED9|nr:AMP-binding protein [Candidatus Paracaedibacter symbiosus]
MTSLFLSEIIHARMKDSPDDLAYTFSTSSDITEAVTYGELFSECRRIALILQELTQDEDIILIAVSPSLNYIKLIYACILANRIFLPTFPIKSRHDMARIESLLQKIPVRLVIHDSRIEEAILGDHFHHTPIKLIKDILNTHPKDVALLPINYHPERPIFLQASSGTTHFPKVV